MRYLLDKEVFEFADVLCNAFDALEANKIKKNEFHQYIKDHYTKDNVAIIAGFLFTNATFFKSKMPGKKWSIEEITEIIKENPSLLSIVSK